MIGGSGLVAAGDQLVDLRTPPLRRCVGVLLPLDEGERTTFQRARWPPTDDFPRCATPTVLLQIGGSIPVRCETFTTVRKSPTWSFKQPPVGSTCSGLLLAPTEDPLAYHG